jgi:hypothetical protein
LYSRGTLAEDKGLARARDVITPEEIWLHVATRRVVASFIDALARSHGWSKVFLISPWISSFDSCSGMNFTQLLQRLKADDATVYVVTRPPEEEWHQNALDELGATGKANIVLVADLHTKLYCAITDQGSLALVGSANLTQKSLTNREIGVLLRESGPGRRIIQLLLDEASDIYRTSGRILMRQRSFKRTRGT